ncbi:MAG: ABC transporter ATP-binding protein [Candidatus Hodarchaeales archaeon]
MESAIEVRNLTKKFPVQMGVFAARSGSSIHAVDNVSFTVKRGETFGLVGESGCGKTTVAKLILGLLKPTEGTIFHSGEDIFLERLSPKNEKRMNFFVNWSFLVILAFFLQSLIELTKWLQEADLSTLPVINLIEWHLIPDLSTLPVINIIDWHGDLFFSFTALCIALILIIGLSNILLKKKPLTGTSYILAATGISAFFGSIFIMLNIEGLLSVIDLTDIFGTVLQFLQWTPKLWSSIVVAILASPLFLTYLLQPTREKIQLIFQDPYSSLNPRMTVYDIIGEPFSIHKLAKGEKRKRRILSLMKTVGLAPFHLYRYPHEFSGGQRQRVVVARALAVQPEILIMDEPVSALDVSVRAQVLNLLEKLQRDFDLTYIFISHDLSVVRYVCDRVGVMYLGQIVEMGDIDPLFDTPQHPYSEALIAAVPVPDPRAKKAREILAGEVPTPIDPPPYCRFAKRCKFAQEVCFQEEPKLIETKPNHWVACFYPKDLRGTDQVPFRK